MSDTYPQYPYIAIFSSTDKGRSSRHPMIKLVAYTYWFGIKYEEQMIIDSEFNKTPSKVFFEEMKKVIIGKINNDINNL